MKDQTRICPIFLGRNARISKRCRLTSGWCALHAPRSAAHIAQGPKPISPPQDQKRTLALLSSTKCANLPTLPYGVGTLRIPCMRHQGTHCARLGVDPTIGRPNAHPPITLWAKVRDSRNVAVWTSEYARHMPRSPFGPSHTFPKPTDQQKIKRAWEGLLLSWGP